MEEFEIHLIYELLATLDIRRVMFDVGANLGMSLWRFAGTGYQVYAFEPNPDIREQLAKFVEDHPNVHVDARAVTDRDGEELPLYTGASLGTSTLSPFYAEHKATTTVRTVTLEKFCGDNSVDEIDFLKIDAEGFDLFVLKGMPWQRIRPAVIMVEFQDAVTKRLGYGFEDIAAFLTGHGYHLLVSEWYPIEGARRNRAVWRRFARYPCEPLDANAWGNFIAVRDKDDFERLAFAARIAEGFITGMEDQNADATGSDSKIARQNAAVQEQIGMIGVYMAQFSPR